MRVIYVEGRIGERIGERVLEIGAFMRPILKEHCLRKYCPGY